MADDLPLEERQSRFNMRASDSRIGLAAPSFISASLVNARVPFVFNSTDVGYVFRPDVVQECMSCSWPSDAYTLGKSCAPGLPPGECLPGCFTEHRLPLPSCATTGALGGAIGLAELEEAAGFAGLCRPWTAGDLGGMMEYQERGLDQRRVFNMLSVWATWTSPLSHDANRDSLYNEVVLDTECVRQRMPLAIEAYYYPLSSDRRVVDLAHSAWRDFLRETGSSATTTPLLAFDLSQPEQPFSVPIRQAQPEEPIPLAPGVSSSSISG